MMPSCKWPILCFCTFCACVFFLTPLPWEFNYAKRSAFLFSKRGLLVRFARGDVNMHKGYRLLPSFNNPLFQYELIWGQVHSLFYEHEFYLHENIKGWALDLVLKQRPGRTRKWAIARWGVNTQSAFGQIVCTFTVYSCFEKGCRKKCARDNPERCRTYFCCFPLVLAKICPWPPVPFFQISLKNSALKTTRNTFRDCRVHFFRQPFSKQL